jgi:hypothetical protein
LLATHHQHALPLLREKLEAGVPDNENSANGGIGVSNIATVGAVSAVDAVGAVDDDTMLGKVMLIRTVGLLLSGAQASSLPTTCKVQLSDMMIYQLTSLYGARFNHGFCCVRDIIIGLRLLYGARFPAEIYTRGCHWIPRMLA